MLHVLIVPVKDILCPECKEELDNCKCPSYISEYILKELKVNANGVPFKHPHRHDGKLI